MDPGVKISLTISLFCFLLLPLNLPIHLKSLRILLYLTESSLFQFDVDSFVPLH